MIRHALLTICSVLITACASKQIEVTYQPDRFGVPVPVINGEVYPMTDQERRAIGQAFVNTYCPAPAKL